MRFFRDNIDFVVYILFLSLVLFLFMVAIGTPAGSAVLFTIFLFLLQLLCKFIFNLFFRFLRGFVNGK